MVSANRAHRVIGLSGDKWGRADLWAEPSEKLLSLSVLAQRVYRLEAAGETFRKPPENYPTPIEGWKNREKRNANPH